jgi:hypothetical protein
MYNTKIPTQAELPTAGQLVPSTAVAAATAAALLVTVVLPAEYGIDPTGVGRVLGLTEMGEIKASHAEEAAEDERATRVDQTPTAPAAPSGAALDQRSDATGLLLPKLASLLVSPAAATAVAEAAKSDETSVTLRPGEGAEVKLEMHKGAKANFAWKAEGGVVNFDTHGEPLDAPNKTHSYEKGRGAASDEGVLEAAFDGNHGWFWRNRGQENVTVNLRISGDYVSVKRVK